jgi:formiminotetrahydrofolate cyclodeaminase
MIKHKKLLFMSLTLQWMLQTTMKLYKEMVEVQRQLFDHIDKDLCVFNFVMGIWQNSSWSHEVRV